MKNIAGKIFSVTIAFVAGSLVVYALTAWREGRWLS